MSVDFVGHPLVEEVQDVMSPAEARNHFELNPMRRSSPSCQEVGERKLNDSFQQCLRPFNSYALRIPTLIG